MKNKLNIFSLTVILFLLITSDTFSQSIIGKIGPLSTHKFEIRNKVIPFNVFMNIDQPTGLVSFNNNINIENTSLLGEKGVINMGSVRFLHAYETNTYLGKNSGIFDGGNSNTGLGYNSLSNNWNGSGNTAVGINSLAHSIGNSNTAIGSNTLVSNAKGYSNTALGVNALLSNIEGHGNTAIGSSSLQNNWGEEGTNSGTVNTAVGNASLFNNISGIGNSSLGHQSDMMLRCLTVHSAIRFKLGIVVLLMPV